MGTVADLAAGAGRTAATQVHHVLAHHGDEYAFWSGELASLCRSCHSIETAKEQGRKVRPQIGLDGWPIDPRHSENRG